MFLRLKRVGSVGLKTFVYYMCTTALAVVIGLILSSAVKGWFPPLDSAALGELTYEAKESPSVMQVIVNIFPDNFFKPMVNADMLPLIVVAILLGAGVLSAGEKGKKIGDATCAIWISKLEQKKAAKAAAKAAK